MAATFSYAQAAKGLAAPVPSGTSNTKSPSEVSPNLAPDTSVSQVEKVQLPEADISRNDTLSTQDSQSTIIADKEAPSHDAKIATPLLNGVSPPGSPDYGVSSTSTLVKDDDQSSAVNASSESTWENKSQVSTAADITAVDASERAQSKGRSKSTDQSAENEKEVPSAKLLREAPPPATNVWAQRMSQRVTVTPAKALAPAKTDTAANKSHSLPEARLTSAIGSTPLKDRKSESGPARNQSESRAANDKENTRPRRSQAPRSASHDTGAATNAPPPPPRDQQSWPTPEIATEEERKKSVEKVEKNEKSDKPDEENAEKKKAHGKNAWTHVPFTPTVVFSTPLPGSGRRGGRGGGRGGREDSSRGALSAANSAPAVADDKKSNVAPVTNGDSTRRSRPESAARSSSPSKKSEVPIPEPIPVPAEQAPQPSESSPTKIDPVGGDAAALPNGHHRRFSVDRPANTTGATSSRGGSTRGRGRRGDFAANGAPRRPDVENGSTAGDQQPVSGPTPAGQEYIDRRKKSVSEDAFSPTKQQPSERRNGNFTYPNSREQRGEPRPRGGRGRGGAHHFQGSQPYANGQFGGAAGPMMPQSYGYPASGSPPGWPQGQQGPYFAPPPQHSNRYRHGNRAQSIPTEVAYGQYGQPYGTVPPHMAPLQTQMGYGYDPQATQSMSAAPFGPYTDQYSLFSMVSMQLEYYFSVDNLIKDVFLRKQMDSQGFVHLSVVANFSRMKKLTTDLDLIKYACSSSRTIEWRVGSDGIDRLRPVKDWQQWVLPVSEREPSARNDGPPDLMMPNMPIPQGFDPYSMHMRHSVGGPQSAAAASAPWQQMNGGPPSHVQSPMSPTDPAYGRMFYPQAQQHVPNGYDQRDPQVSRPPMVNGHPHSMDPEADSFSDAAAAKLMVVVGNSNSKQLPPAAARTFSNGSIDLSTSTEEQEKPRNDSGPITNGDDSHRGRTGHPDHAPSASQDSSASVDGSKLCWIKSDDSPVTLVPGREETARYPVLRDMALQERAEALEGVCPHNLIILYKFWAHFLPRNFNSTMYNEFRYLAMQDYHERQSDIGYHNLLKFYQHVLASERPIRGRLARHYASLALAERQNDNDQEQLAFKQLRTQWRDGATDMRNRKKLSEHLNEELKTALEQ